MPFLNWFVLTVSATAEDGSGRRLSDLDEILPEAGEVLDPLLRDDDVVLDANRRTRPLT